MITIKTTITACLLAFCLGKLAWANNSGQGQKLYQACVACHGANGEGNAALNTPALAGQHQWYLARQLKNFQSGVRGDHTKDKLAKQMVPFAKSLSDTDIQQLTNYLGQLSKHKKQAELSGNLKNGYKYYQSKCGACHGERGEGNKSFSAPKLTGLSGKYLARQMTNFQTGVRGYAKEDRLGRQMALMAKMSSGQELNDILFFLESQK